MKFMGILIRTTLLLCLVGAAFGQNAASQNTASQNKTQSAQKQAAKPAVATKPAAATKSAVKSVQVKAETAKPTTVKAAQVKTTAPKSTTIKAVQVKATASKTATTKPVAVKAATAKPLPVNSTAAHATPVTVKIPVHTNTAAKTNNSAVKVATYPAKTKSASPMHALRDKKVASVKKDPFQKEKKAAIEVTKTKTAVPEKTADKASDKTVEKTEDKVVLTGRRDPFVSPVMEQSASNAGCSTGKRCLAIDQISLKGIVKSENGMIAVVENALDKAYFLHENDPVFDGYVVKITGDSIIFRETLQDKLGKAFTRDVTKRISTPAV